VLARGVQQRCERRALEQQGVDARRLEASQYFRCRAIQMPGFSTIRRNARDEGAQGGFTVVGAA
jgi:hypothetical protein